jgi:Flp pilus assembly pilin Flp
MWMTVPLAAIKSVRRWTRRNDGQDLLEYGLLASLIAMFLIGAVSMVGGKIGDVLWQYIAATKF